MIPVHPNSIPEATLETLARTFSREASAYGFNKIDYLRFVNLLLDFSMKAVPSESGSDHNVESEKALIPKLPVQSNGFPLMGHRIKIRKLNDGDEELFEKWLSDQQGRYFLLSCSKARSITLGELFADKSSFVGVVTLLDGTPIGSVVYLDHDPIQRKAELRKIIGRPDLRGKGLAKEATQLWIRYGTGKMGIKKIYLNALDTNIRNIKLNEELGFRVEGILRNDVFFDEKHHDVLRMALLSEDEGCDAVA